MSAATKIVIGQGRLRDRSRCAAVALTCFLLFLFSCRGKQRSYRFEMSTGKMVFRVPAGTYDSIKVLAGPVNMDSVLRSHLQTSMDRVGSVRAQLQASYLYLDDTTSGADFSWLKKIHVSGLDNFSYPYPLSEAVPLTDTAVHAVNLRTVNTHNVSSLFVNRDRVLFQCTVQPGKAIPRDMTCTLELLFTVNIIGLDR